MVVCCIKCTYAVSVVAVSGEWKTTEQQETIPDPMNGEPFVQYSSTQMHETAPFVEALKKVPKSGLHNAYKNPERCL